MSFFLFLFKKIILFVQFACSQFAVVGIKIANGKKAQKRRGTKEKKHENRKEMLFLVLRFQASFYSLWMIIYWLDFCFYSWFITVQCNPYRCYNVVIRFYVQKTFLMLVCTFRFICFVGTFQQEQEGIAYNNAVLTFIKCFPKCNYLILFSLIFDWLFSFRFANKRLLKCYEFNISYGLIESCGNLLKFFQFILNGSIIAFSFPSITFVGS